MKFETIKPGDIVVRMLGGTIPMELVVTEVSDTVITCGDWTFDRNTGAEIDADLEWGPEYGMTGSFLKEVKP
jgi:hypothetical protein